MILVTLVLQGRTLPWVIKRLEFKVDKLAIPAEVQSLQIRGMLTKLSLQHLQVEHTGLLNTNSLVKTFEKRLNKDLDFTHLNIQSLQNTKVDEKQEVAELKKLLYDIGRFQHKQIARVRLNELFDEEVIPKKESRFDLDENKIG